jgi:NADH-quinone oxidoreductase subunit M
MTAMTADLSELTGLAALTDTLGRLPLLSILTFLPALGALVLWQIAEEGEHVLIRRVTLGFLLAGLLPLAAVLAVCDFSAKTAPPLTSQTVVYENATALQEPLTERRPWLAPEIGSSYHLGVDGTNIWLLMLTLAVAPVAVAASSGIDRRVKEFHVLVLLLQSALTGAFLAQDLLLFYLFFEFTLIPTYLLVGLWGGPERRAATTQLFLYTFLGSVFTLGGMLWLAAFYAQVAGGPMTFDIQTLFAKLPAAVAAAGPETKAYWAAAQFWVFLALAGAFLVKIPVWPLHSWLPLSYVEAPLGVTVLLSAVLGKLGAYGLLKFVVPLVPHGALQAMPLIVGGAVIAVVYASLAALASRDFKRLLAYSSMAHVSWCVVGTFALTVQGFGGAILQMVTHGLASAGLFVIAGALAERFAARDLDSYSGLWRSMPVMAFYLLFFILAAVGMPGLGGFVSEFLILAGMFPVSAVADLGTKVTVPGAVYAVLTATGILLGAWYLFGAARSVLFGPERTPAGRPVIDFGLREHAMLVPLAVLLLAIGVFPRTFLRPMEKPLAALVRTVEAGGVRVQPPGEAPTPAGPTVPSATADAGGAH